VGTETNGVGAVFVMHTLVGLSGTPVDQFDASLRSPSTAAFHEVSHCLAAAASAAIPAEPKAAVATAIAMTETFGLPRRQDS
jgi:hypothetical protein